MYFNLLLPLHSPGRQQQQVSYKFVSRVQRLGLFKEVNIHREFLLDTSSFGIDLLSPPSLPSLNPRSTLE